MCGKPSSSKICDDGVGALVIGVFSWCEPVGKGFAWSWAAVKARIDSPQSGERAKMCGGDRVCGMR